MAHSAIQDRTLRITTNPPLVPGSYVFGKKDGKGFVALKRGDAFHATPCFDDSHRNEPQSTYSFNPELPGVIYGPVHPSTQIADVEGSTYAHDTGTVWLFSHCSPQEQTDFAADVRTFAVDQFAVAIAKAQVKAVEASNAPAQALAVSKLKALVAFAEAVGTDCHDRVVKAVLGHYHRDAHNDHRRDLAVAGIDAILATWLEAGKTDKAIRQDRSHVSAVASTLRAALMATHSIEWRHEREARLEAERKAAAMDNAASEATESLAEQGE